ncbi:biogenesis of lysosome-related organelles complex 1 subunit 6 [Scomber scombrus]|uniref:Biogenesis of lysosome-related organelles complex 1 subunit 6 n=1 Tax=Scomber scombrus TaxID=13677 RepID=A0AAV1Q8C9_SCOSC
MTLQTQQQISNILSFLSLLPLFFLERGVLNSTPLLTSTLIDKQVWLYSEGAHMEVEGLDDKGASSHSELALNDDLQLVQQESVRLESSAPVENVFVDRKAVDKLTEGLLSHYLPDLQNSKRALQELTQNQLILLDTLDQEVTKFRECNALLDLNSLFTEAKIYHNKLVNIRKEMIMLHEKTTKLKKRALKLQQHKQKEELEKEQQREKELERERQLIAKPAKRA